MSYDVLVFLPEAAPAERDNFLTWFFRVVRLQDGHMSGDPRIAPPLLARWHEDMARAYPPFAGPHAPAGVSNDDITAADYRFSDVAIFARFQWEVSRRAVRKAQKTAQLHGLGLFEVSAEDSPVWMPVGERFRVVHHGDPPDRAKLPQ